MNKFVLYTILFCSIVSLGLVRANEEEEEKEPGNS